MGFIVALLLVIWVVFAVRSLRRDGSCSCGSGSGDCSRCGNKGKCKSCGDKCDK